MFGIIYKLTILAAIKQYGNKPYYIGQHWCNSVTKFSTLEDEYWGGGKIWNDFLSVLKKRFPHQWRHLIRREVLYSSENITQKGLDALEAYYIKKEKSYYLLKLGGCNVLLGTANSFGSGSPMKDINCRKKQSLSLKRYYATHPGNNTGKHWSKEMREHLSKVHMGQRHSQESIERMRKTLTGRKRPEVSRKMKAIFAEKKRNGTYVPTMLGRKFSDEHRRHISEGLKRHYETHDGYMKGKKMSKETRLKMSKAQRGRTYTFKNPEAARENRRLGAYKGWKTRRKNNR